VKKPRKPGKRPRNGKAAPSAPSRSIDINIGTAPGQVAVRFGRMLDHVVLNPAQAIRFAQGLADAAEKANAELQAKLAKLADAVGGPEELAKIAAKARAAALAGQSCEEEEGESCNAAGSDGSSGLSSS